MPDDDELGTDQPTEPTEPPALTPSDQLPDLLVPPSDLDYELAQRSLGRKLPRTP